MANEKKKRSVFFDIFQIPEELIRALGFDRLIDAALQAEVQANNPVVEDVAESDDDEIEDGGELGYIGRMMR